MSISNAVRKCEQILISAQANTTLTSNLRLELANVLVRLKIWAGDIGVFAPDTASVDIRLREDPDLMEFMFSMSRKLEYSLESAVDPPNQGESDHEEGEGDCWSSPVSVSSGSSSASKDLNSTADEPSSDCELKRLGPSAIYIEEANNVINRLYRLATVFKTSLLSSENAKTRELIKGLKEKGETEELKVVETRSLSYIKAHFPKAPEFLISRLVETVVFRRMKIRYRQHHQEQPNQDLEQAFASLEACYEDMEAPNTGASTLSSRTPSKSNNFGDEGRTQPMPQNVAFSATTTSSVNLPRIAEHETSPAVCSVVTQAAEGSLQQLHVPSPPKNNGEDKVECPYCLKMIGQEETEQPRWTRHVLDDIEPFICLFKDCGESLKLFKTSDEWLGHMRWQHTIVFCCQVVGHEREIFGSSQELESHVRKEHPDTFTESQLAGLVRQGARPAAETLGALNTSLSLKDCRCVLCDTFVAQSARTGTMDLPEFEINSERKMQSHVLQHLEDFALLALPDDVDAEDLESDAWQSTPSPLTDQEEDFDSFPWETLEDLVLPERRAAHDSVPHQDRHDVFSNANHEPGAYFNANQEHRNSSNTSRYVEFYIKSYGITTERLRDYFQQLFPGYNIAVNTAPGDNYVVYLPRQLNQAEVAELYRALRRRRPR